MRGLIWKGVLLMLLSNSLPAKNIWWEGERNIPPALSEPNVDDIAIMVYLEAGHKESERGIELITECVIYRWWKYAPRIRVWDYFSKYPRHFQGLANYRNWYDLQFHINNIPHNCIAPGANWEANIRRWWYVKDIVVSTIIYGDNPTISNYHHSKVPLKDGVPTVTTLEGDTPLNIEHIEMMDSLARTGERRKIEGHFHDFYWVVPHRDYFKFRDLIRNITL